MPLLRQVGGPQAQLHSLRYRLRDGRVYELSFNLSESPLDEDVIEGLELLDQLEPEDNLPFLGSRRTESVSKVSEAWLDQAGRRLEALKRLATVSDRDSVVKVLRQGLALKPHGQTLSTADLIGYAEALSELERHLPAGDFTLLLEGAALCGAPLERLRHSLRKAEKAQKALPRTIDPYELASLLDEDELKGLFAHTAELDPAGLERTLDLHLFQQFLRRRKLSKQTAGAFALSAKKRRLRIPLLDADGQLLGYDTQALLPRVECRNCGETVTSKQWHQAQQDHKRVSDMLRRRGQRSEQEPRRCPFCAADERASGLWILDGQFPRFHFETPAPVKPLYNAAAAGEALDQGAERLYLVEGYSDVWALHEAGEHAAVSYNRSDPNDEQLELLFELLDTEPQVPLVLVPHQDQMGRDRVSYILNAIAERRPEQRVLIVDLGLAPLPQGVANPFGLAKLDAASALQLFGAQDFRLLLFNPSYVLDGVAWMVRVVLETRRPDGTHLQSASEEERSVAFYVEGAGYEPERESLFRLLRANRPEWSGQEVEQFVERLLEARAGRALGEEQMRWIEAHGSDELKYAIERGYDALVVYLEERAERELGSGSLVDRDGTFRPGKRNHPSRAALRLERELPARVRDSGGEEIAPERLRVVYGYDQEWIRVDRYLGRYSAFVPVKESA